jgi:hypothetical protein
VHSVPNHKWTVRLYILLTHRIAGEHFSIYFYPDGLVGFCDAPYAEPSPGNFDKTSYVTRLGNASVTDATLPKIIWSAVFEEIYRKVRSVQRIPCGQNEPIDPRKNEIMNRFREIVLFSALAIWPWIEHCTVARQLSDRPYFHIVGMDVMFDADGNPQLLGLNDRPGLIRRPADGNQEQNTALIEEALRIVFGLPSMPDPKWEKLYPTPPMVRPPWRLEVISRKLPGNGEWMRDVVNT